MKKLYLILLIIFGVFASCDIEYDPFDPRIASYTEVGANTSSAYVNGNPWNGTAYNVSVLGRYRREIYLEYNIKKDSLVFGFLSKTPIMFTLQGFNITDFKDFIKLKDKKIELDGVKNFGYWDNYERIYGQPFSIEKPAGVGQIYFKNVNYVDTGKLIISGGFGFEEKNRGIKITQGRFDYVILKSNFDASKK